MSVNRLALRRRKNRWRRRWKRRIREREDDSLRLPELYHAVLTLGLFVHKYSSTHQSEVPTYGKVFPLANIFVDINSHNFNPANVVVNTRNETLIAAAL